VALPCSDVLIIGARGSSEARGWGGRVSHIVNRITRTHDQSRTMGRWAIGDGFPDNYPAHDVSLLSSGEWDKWFEGLNAGRKAVVDRLRGQWVCPG
jgi:hypothetical protein